MSDNEFRMWLVGFTDGLANEGPSVEQWNLIKKRLNNNHTFLPTNYFIPYSQCSTVTLCQNS